MARPSKGTCGIVVDAQHYRWKIVPPKPSDCPLCASWHIEVIGDPAHELVAEWTIDVDPTTERPLTVTPLAVAERLRGRTAQPQTKHFGAALHLPAAGAFGVACIELLLERVVAASQALRLSLATIPAVLSSSSR